MAKKPEETPVVVEEKKEDKKVEYLKSGRESGTCAGCGAKLVRPSIPDNSTWRCQKYILGEATPDCQRGIPRDRVLDESEVAAKIKARLERHKQEDIG